MALLDIDIVCEAFSEVYGKPLPWHRFFFYSFAENEQYLKYKVRDYIDSHRMDTNKTETWFVKFRRLCQVNYSEEFEPLKSKEWYQFWK